jgi:hypothetical protein
LIATAFGLLAFGYLRIHDYDLWAWMQVSRSPQEAKEQIEKMKDGRITTTVFPLVMLAGAFSYFVWSIVGWGAYRAVNKVGLGAIDPSVHDFYRFAFARCPCGAIHLCRTVDWSARTSAPKLMMRVLTCA